MTGSRIEHFADHLVMRTPHNPDHHWGNSLLVTNTDSIDDADRWVAYFTDVFPEAAWFAAGLPSMPRNTQAWSEHGISLVELDVLTMTAIPHGSPLADGYTSRHLINSDWDQAVRRDIDENLRTREYDPVVHERFVRESVAARRKLCEEGHAAWFGAFRGDALVAELGIVRCGDLARYQEVGTDEAHRRRGLASHLLGLAAQWSADQGCDTWVIVTESTNDAGRVYRRAGFALTESQVNAYRRPVT